MIAVLRSRLWNIHRLINRALVYAVLTATLAAIYIASVLGFQALFRLVAGNTSELAIAFSTLATAALVNPLRRRIQAGIDRRFYRQRYNAARVLAAFGETCRDETKSRRAAGRNRRRCGADYAAAYISLWLREDKR